MHTFTWLKKVHSFSQTRTYFHLAKSTFSQQLHLFFHPNRFISSQAQVFSNSTGTQTAPEQPHPRHKSSPIPLSPKQPQNNLIPYTSSPGWGRCTKQHTNFHRSRLVVDTVARGDADALQGLVMLGVPPSPSMTKLHLWHWAAVGWTTIALFFTRCRCDTV